MGEPAKVEVEEVQELPKGIALMVPKPMHRALRQLSVDLDIPMSELIRQALQRYIDEQVPGK